MKVFYSHFSQIRHSTLLVVGFIPYSILTLLYYLTFLGPNWSAGLRSWPDLVCHRLHRQVPCPLQNWSNNSEICVLVHFCSLLVVAVVDHIYWPRFRGRSWPRPTASPGCFAHWLVPSILLQSSSMTLHRVDFFWESCHGCCRQYVLASWMFLYPFLGPLILKWLWKI